MRTAFKIIILVFSFLISACAPSRFVKPLDKGQKAISAHLGGELIKFGGAVIPIPFTSLAYGQGLSAKTTCFGSLHLTSALFGNFQTDFGLVHQLYRNDSLKIGVTISPVINFMCHAFKEDARLFPQLDVNVYHDYGKRKNFVYLGVSNWADLTKTRAHGEKQQYHYILSPQFGNTFVRSKWNYTLELKYIAPGINNKYVVAEYYNPLSKMGALGFYFAATRKF
jgi:hypothetical protein